MSSGGMGDILSGVIASMLTQGFCPECVNMIGTNIHSYAADYAS